LKKCWCQGRAGIRKSQTGRQPAWKISRFSAPLEQVRKRLTPDLACLSIIFHGAKKTSKGSEKCRSNALGITPASARHTVGRLPAGSIFGPRAVSLTGVFRKTDLSKRDTSMTGTRRQQGRAGRVIGIGAHHPGLRPWGIKKTGQPSAGAALFS